MFSRVAASRGLPLMRANIESKKVLVHSSRTLTWREDVEVWRNANDVYYGPDRDTKNFPAPKQPESAPPTRLGIVPESYFKFFYNKTGVTGPYMFGGGVLTALFSKELWIVDHNFVEFFVFGYLIYYINKKYGDRISNYMNRQQDIFMEERFIGPLTESKEFAMKKIEDIEKQVWREDGQKFLFEAKRENVDLQLEAEYRKRQQEIYQDVKKRLDYQLESENTKRRFEQNHMVNWIVGGVVKGITPQQERDSISKCIKALKALAQKTQVATA